MFLQRLDIKNVLSFGRDTPTLDLAPLNVLVGPNGSGKSNLLDVLEYLRALPRNIKAFMRRVGGEREWIWKGRGGSDRIEVVVQAPGFQSPQVRYLTTDGFLRQDEFIWRITEDGEVPVLSPDGADYVALVRDETVRIRRHGPPAPGNPGGEWDDEDSVLSQLRDRRTYPEITALADSFSRIRLFRDFHFGRSGSARDPARMDLPSDFLEEDLSNLPLVMNALRSEPSVKRRILEYLGRLAEPYDDLDVRIEGTMVRLFVQEGEWIVPSSRLSDGTLRFLCLLAILLHPTPPPLVAIEEPELGFHPDLMPTLAELLLQASKRTQLIVTTHSDLLVDAFTEHPEALVICDKVNGSTHMHRLDPEKMASWLREYSLGRLWRTGEIGGNRW